MRFIERLRRLGGEAKMKARAIFKKGDIRRYVYDLGRYWAVSTKPIKGKDATVFNPHIVSLYSKRHGFSSLQDVKESLEDLGYRRVR